MPDEQTPTQPFLPFNQISLTPHLDAYQPTPAILAADLTRILSGVDQAIPDKGTAAQIQQLLGTVLSLVKPFILALVVALCLGCSSTPPSISEAHKVEGECMAIYAADVARCLSAYEADLRLALDVQVDIIQGYEIRLATGVDGKIEVEKVNALLAAAKAKKAEIEDHLAAARGKVASIEVHHRVAVAVHERIAQYLDAPGLTVEAVMALMKDVTGLVRKPPAE